MQPSGYNRTTGQTGQDIGRTSLGTYVRSLSCCGGKARDLRPAGGSMGNAPADPLALENKSRLMLVSSEWTLQAISACQDQYKLSQCEID